MAFMLTEDRTMRADHSEVRHANYLAGFFVKFAELLRNNFLIVIFDTLTFILLLS